MWKSIFVLKVDDDKIKLLGKTLHDLSNPDSKNYANWLKVVHYYYLYFESKIFMFIFQSITIA